MRKMELTRKAISSLTREELELQLFETRRILNLIMENNPFSIFWKDSDLVYRGCNQRFEKIAQMDSPDAVIGKTDHDMPWGIDNEVGANACRSSDARVISSKMEEMHIIELIKQESGETAWTDTSKVPICDPDGRVDGVLGVLEDITARKVIEDKLKEVSCKLEELSRTDALTNIANRRYFDEFLKNEWSRGSRNQSGIALIIFDIDHFKQLNDKHGHLAGDQCLRLVADIAKNALKRPTDFIARYGGEEFVIILMDVTIEGAVKIAEDIRVAIEKARLTHEGKSIGVSVSLGVALEVPSKDTSPERLIATADQALYRAKDSGRNSVVAAESPLGAAAKGTVSFGNGPG
jgi:diguanylate cyclase (GGDEF)-like protein/PAS domain S-box-containing protein